LRTSEQGLSHKEAEERLRAFGENSLPEPKPDSLLVIFLRQFQSPLIYILLAAALVVLIMGQTNDGAIIVAVLFFNAIIGTIQEGRANKTLSALKRIVETTAAVVRDNKEILIPSQVINEIEKISEKGGGKDEEKMMFFEGF